MSGGYCERCGAEVLATFCTCAKQPPAEPPTKVEVMALIDEYGRYVTLSTANSIHGYDCAVSRELLDTARAAVEQAIDALVQPGMVAVSICLIGDMLNACHDKYQESCDHNTKFCDYKPECARLRKMYKKEVEGEIAQERHHEKK